MNGAVDGWVSMNNLPKDHTYVVQGYSMLCLIKFNKIYMLLIHTFMLLNIYVVQAIYVVEQNMLLNNNMLFRIMCHWKNMSFKTYVLIEHVYVG